MEPYFLMLFLSTKGQVFRVLSFLIQDHAYICILDIYRFKTLEITCFNLRSNWQIMTWLVGYPNPLLLGLHILPVQLKCPWIIEEHIS